MDKNILRNFLYFKKTVLDDIQTLPNTWETERQLKTIKLIFILLSLNLNWNFH